ncbi:MAG: hypothetical protein R3D98_05695 [Candidatus Krumholzibacteriia bacterium]
MPRILLPLVLCAALLPAARAQIVTHNPAEPAGGLVTMPLAEQWRVGGEDDDIFFGTVAGLATTADGELLVLDGQQSQIQVYGQDGTWLRTLSREGAGPGETRNPGGVFIDHSGDVCLLHGMSGQIVRLHADGTPAEARQFQSQAAGAGSLVILIGAGLAGDGLDVAGMRIIFGQASGNGQMYFLSRCDTDGREQQVILEKLHPIDYADFVLDELAMDFVWSRWTTDQAGRTYVAPARNEYRIEVHAPDGSLERVITRDYTSYRRDAELKRIATLIVEAVGAYHPVPPRAVTIEDTEPDILGMWVAPDGLLWVQTSRGMHDKPAGAYAAYDLFDPAGTFLRQVALICDADPRKDGLSMLSDGRIVVVTGSLDAWLAQQQVERSEAELDAAAANPLEVVVYSPAR